LLGALWLLLLLLLVQVEERRRVVDDESEEAARDFVNGEKDINLFLKVGRQSSSTTEYSVLIPMSVTLHRNSLSSERNITR
jgi:hypothetical protein